MNITNQGRTSKTAIVGGTFIKEGASYTGYCFQSWCQSHVVLPTRFRINNVIEYSHGEAKYKLLDEKPWKLDYSRASLIGSVMGDMHRQCLDGYENGELKFLPIKSFTPPQDVEKYDIGPAELELRNECLSDIHINVNSSTPKVPLHRDFRLHNIIFDGSCLNLIDFDFAGVDIVSHEVTAMLLDISYINLEYIDVFLQQYIKHCGLDITDNIIDEHMYYLATDTFPYDRKDSLTQSNYNSLCAERASRLNRLRVFRKDFKNSLNNALANQ